VRVSPDGQWIAFVVGPDFLGPWELRLTRSDGGEARTLFRSERTGGLRPLAWSPDSRKLLCLSQSLEGSMTQQKNNLVLLDIPSGAVHTIKTDLGLARQALSGGISPDGRYVAYSDGRQTRIFAASGPGEATVANAGGSESRVLGWLPDSEDLIIGSGLRTPDSFGIYRVPIREGQPGPPELLRGGLETFDAVGIDASGAIYYDLQHHGLMNGYTASVDAGAGKLVGQPARVTSKLENLNAIPMWSPDGKKLAWIGLQSGYVHMDGASITVRDLATGRETTAPIQLPANRSMPQWMPSPAWTSDNRHVLMMAVDDRRVLSLYKVDAASGRAVEVAAEVTRYTLESQFSQAAWSNDGSTLYRVEGLNAIAMRKGSSEWRKVLTEPTSTFVYEPTPSPDGKEIAYVVAPEASGRNARIKIVTLETGQVRTIVNAQPIRQRREIIWTADSRYLVYPTSSGPAGKSQLWVVASSGGAARKLGPEIEGQIFDLSVSPDGQIGFTLRTIRHELWAVRSASR
jgi:Tol biopolymer transport system component